jgi:hypothetical protein
MTAILVALSVHIVRVTCSLFAIAQPRQSQSLIMFQIKPNVSACQQDEAKTITDVKAYSEKYL